MSRFAGALLTVLFLTVLAVAIQFVLVLKGEDSAMAMDLADTCSTAWTAGTGAIFGLLAGKAS